MKLISRRQWLLMEAQKLIDNFAWDKYYVKEWEKYIQEKFKCKDLKIKFHPAFPDGDEEYYKVYYETSI